MKTSALLGAALLAAWLLPCPPATAQAPERIPILFDTDLGSDIDDAFALALILASPELDLRGVTTSGSDPNIRALMACRFLTMTGRRHTAVAAGAAPQPKREIAPYGQYRYYYHPDVLFNRTIRPQKESAVEFLQARLKSQSGKITIIAAGPLTNIARLFTTVPESKKWVKRVIFTADGASFDKEATQTVLNAGVPLIVIPCSDKLLTLSEEGVRRIFAPVTALSLQVQAMHELWDKTGPVLTDAFAVALCLNEGLCELLPKALGIDEEGRLTVTALAPANAQLASAIQGERFLKWYVERMASCVSPASRPVPLVAQGDFPHRVHVAEDFDTNIERFWWMAGKEEHKNLPPGSLRACRGTLTHDYDDLLGHTKAMWTSVTFNPVPGPPMGKNTRLSFRYWLKGTDTLRVQIYSLTNGYHRQLYVKGLPQGKWEHGTVDMTLARRPDGTGGPLAEGERIDDIQFYVEPTTELLIDDIVLYDAAAPDEKRPFPKTIQFAAGFDSGQQGKQWPGSFTIVADKGYFWRAAQSVPNEELGKPWIRMQLRGERPLGAQTALTFRYRLTGADSMRVQLLQGKTTLAESTLQELKKDEWTQATVPLTLKEGARADAVQFLLPTGAELLVDDVVLYEPGARK